MHFGFRIVPQQTATVVERLGKFSKTLTPGFHILIPVLDVCAYDHSLKEEAHEIMTQTAITKDNVTIHIDGVLYLKIIDPYKASYGVSNPLEAMRQLAMTTMRSEMGKLTFDKTFEERENLNHNIVRSINDSSDEWGILCMRYEIKDIVPPTNIRKAMELQAESERQKRADILTSEGRRQAEINIAEGHRSAAILSAEGEAKAILTKADATAEGIKVLAEAIETMGGEKAVKLRVAEQYVAAFGEMAKTNNTMIIPAEPNNIASIVGKSLGIFKAMDLADGTKQQNEPSENYRPEKRERVRKYDEPVLDSTD